MSLTTLLRDFGNRTATNGWGTPATGPAWTTAGGAAADYSVGAGLGKMSLASVNVQRVASLTPNSADLDIRVDVQIGSATPAGNGYEVGVQGRWVDASNFVDMRIFYATTGVVTIAIRQVVAGVETAVGFPVVKGVGPNSPVSVRLAAFGNQLMGKAWPVGLAEPAAWTVSMTTTMLTAGQFRLYATLGAGNTNTLPVPATFTNLSVTTGATPLGFVYPTDADLLCGTGTPAVTALEQLAESVQAFLTTSNLDALSTTAALGIPRAQTVVHNTVMPGSFQGPMDSVVFNTGTPTDLAVFPNGNVVDTGIWLEIVEAVVPQQAGLTMCFIGSDSVTFSATTDAQSFDPEYWGGGNQCVSLQRTLPNLSLKPQANWVGGGISSATFTWLAITTIKISENLS